MKTFTHKYQVLIFIAVSVMFPLKSSALFEIVPENPMLGQNIQLRYVGCDPVAPNITTNELYYLEQQGNLINFIGSYGYGLPTCPFTFEHYYDIGAFPVGEYQIDVYDVIGTVPFPIDTNEGDPSLSITFGVTAPIQIPLTDWPAVIILIGLLILVVRFHFFKEEKL